MRFLLILLSLPAWATNYYVAASGSNSNNGTSPGTPWQTVSKVNSGTYVAGDTINFNGGDTFSGTTLSVSLVGSAGNPIIIQSYGTGQGIISVGSCGSPAVTHGISLTDPQYVTITNLTITGAGWTGSGLSTVVCDGGNGIYILSDHTSGPLLQSVTITSNTISGFYYGVLADAGKSTGNTSTVGWNNLTIDHNTLSGNLSGSILVQGANVGSSGPNNAYTTVDLSFNTATNSPGDPNSGSGGVHGSIKTEAGGINLGNTTGFTINSNYVSGVGGFGGALSGLTLGGSTGIVASNSATGKIDNNEVSNTACSTHFDGDAIDIDQATSGVDIAFNLTYLNVGPSVQLGSFGGPITSGIRVHHNISYNDVRGNNTGGTSEQGAIRLWGSTSNTQVFNNTVVIQTGYVGTPSGMNFEAGSNNTVYALNNVFTVPSGIGVFWSNTTNNPTNMGSPTILGNLYDSSGGSLLISNNNGSGSQTITTLATWHGLGYETLSAVLYGAVGAAKLWNVAGFSPPTNGFGTANINGVVTNFNLLSSSPGVGAGINPSLVSVTLGPVDYHGNASMRGSLVDMGASTFVSQNDSRVWGKATVRGRSTAR